MSIQINYISGEYPTKYRLSYNGLSRNMGESEYKSLVPHFYEEENPDPRSYSDWPKCFKNDIPKNVKYYLIKSLIHEYKSIAEYERKVKKYKQNIEELTKLNQELNDLD